MPKFVSEDGRAFTNYLPSCSLNQSIQNQFKLDNSHQYRYFLQQNSDQVKQFVHSPVAGCEICPVCGQSLDWKPQQPQPQQ